MSDVESGLSAGAQPPKLTKEQVIAVANDRELRALKPGSPEYKTAFDKKFSNKSTTSSASEAETSEVPADAKNEVSASNTEGSDNDDGTGKPGPSKKVDKRIAKLIAERETTKAERDRLAAELAELKKGRTTETAKPQETTQESTTKFEKAKPKVEDFKLVSEYVEAMADWKADKRDFDKEQAAKVKTANESMSSRLNKFFDTGKQVEKDLGLEEGMFDLVVKDKDFVVYDPARDYTLENESGFCPQIMFEIANNEETKAKFSKLSPAQQLAYIGKLEAKYEAQKQETKDSTKTISAAKAPGKSLAKGSPNPTQGFRFSKGMNFKDYEAQRKAERTANGFRK